MKFHFDENIPDRVISALSYLCIDHEIISTKIEFGQGTADEDFLPKIGKIGGILITQDFNMNRIKHQRELLISEKIGVFFIRPPKKSNFSFLDLARLVLKHWEDIEKIVSKRRPPFAYTITPVGKMKSLDLE